MPDWYDTQWKAKNAPATDPIGIAIENGTIDFRISGVNKIFVNQSFYWEEAGLYAVDPVNGLNVVRITPNGIDVGLNGVNGPFNSTLTGNGLVVQKTDGSTTLTNQIIINAAVGIKIQKNTGTYAAPTWVDKFYVDTNGVLNLVDMIASGSISGSTITGGTISGTNISGVTITGSTITAIDNFTVKQSSAVKASITIGDGLGDVTPASINYSGTDVPVADVNLTLTSVSNITLQGSSSGYVRVVGSQFQANNGIKCTGALDASGYTVTATTFSGNATGVDALGADAVLKCSAGNYALMNASYMQVVIGGAIKHQFNADGTKVGGTIEIDGKNWGMSPVDSPRILISDLILGQKITPKGTIILLDEKFSKAINGYAVFPSRSDVVISGKKKDSFCVSGIGEVDLYIIGKRVGQEDVNWINMALPEGV